MGSESADRRRSTWSSSRKLSKSPLVGAPPSKSALVAQAAPCDRASRRPGFEEHHGDHDEAAEHHQAAEYLGVEPSRLQDDLDHRRSENQDVAEPEQPHAGSDVGLLVRAPGPPPDYQ